MHLALLHAVQRRFAFNVAYVYSTEIRYRQSTKQYAISAAKYD